MKEQAQWELIPLWPFGTLEQEYPYYLCKKGKHTLNSHCWIYSCGYILGLIFPILYRAFNKWED